MFKSVTVDTEYNILLCSTELVGKGEIVEVYSLDSLSPSQSQGRILKKIRDPNIFIVIQTYDGHEAMGREYELGQKCILRILLKNISGARRRRFSEEKNIVNIEKGDNFKDKKIVKSKTGSVRKKSNIK